MLITLKYVIHQLELEPGRNRLNQLCVSLG